MNSLTIHESANEVVPVISVGGSNIVFRSKNVKVGDRTYQTDAEVLMRTIKNLSQTIGEHKQQNDIYSAVLVAALRKARSDMVSLLETNFHIHWKINKHTSESVFYM